jgi:putative redox protein
MEAKATWKSGLSFDGTASSGFVLPMGSSIESGGAEDGFRPMELLAIGLVGCTGMDVISILKKKRQEVTAFEVKVHAVRATTDPKIFTEMEIEYVVTGKAIDPKAVERAVELSETKYCSAQAMLGKVAKIGHIITIVEG